MRAAKRRVRSEPSLKVVGKNAEKRGIEGKSRQKRGKLKAQEEKRQADRLKEGQMKPFGPVAGFPGAKKAGAAW